MNGPVNFMDDEIGFEIRKIHLILNREFEKYKRKAMPTKMQFAIILFICHNNAQNKNTYQRDIEKQFEVRASTATEILRKMEIEELITREDDENDKRLKKIVLTKKAIEIKEEFHSNYQKLKAKVCKNITKEEIQTFVNVAKKIQRNLLEDDNV